MKNAIKAGLKIGFAALLLLAVAGGCGSGPSKSKIDELDTAIRDASNYLNSNIPKGNKIVILNIQSSSPDLSDYIIDELIANAVNDRGFSVVDRQQLDAIRAEQNFQLSGEVDDDAALEIGKFFGAQTIISGGLNRLGTGYRIRIRALEVQTAQVQGQYNRNIASSPMVAAIMESGGGSQTAASGGRTVTQTTASAGSRPASGLTITGLSAHRGSYVIAMPDQGTGIWAFEGLSDEGDLITNRIGGDSVTLNVWRVEGETATKYNGSDKRVSISIHIVNRALILPENFISSTIEYRDVEVNFTNGTGSANFLASPAQTFAPAQPATPAQPAAPAQPVVTSYKVGDTGPAGGLIFYDKGNNNGGWRYLEAAPIDIQAKWSVYGTQVGNTQTSIGSGKRNTQLIVEKFKQTSGEWDTAAQQVDELVYGGFDDWFMPSRDELDQMYGNLKRRNLGDFKNDDYWSSTENQYHVHAQDFSNGFMGGGFPKSYEKFVRPIRQVSGQ